MKYDSLKAAHDLDKSLCKAEMRENYDEEVADGLTEDTSFDLMMVIAGIKYFNFKKHQS